MPDLVRGQARRCSCVVPNVFVHSAASSGLDERDIEVQNDEQPGEVDAGLREEQQKNSKFADHWQKKTPVSADSRSFKLGMEMFARRPQEAVHYWAETGVLGVENPCDAAIAKFLYEHRELDRAALWEFLAPSKPVLEAFVRLFDIRDRPLDEAMREVFGTMGLFAHRRDGAADELGIGSPGGSGSSWGHRAGPKSIGSLSKRSSQQSKRTNRRFSVSLSRRASFSTCSRSLDDATSTAFGSENGNSMDGDFDFDGEDTWRTPDRTLQENRRVAFRVFSNWYWALNEDIISAWYMDANVIFAVVLQLASVSESRIAHVDRRRATRGHATHDADLEAAGLDFIETCQNIMMSLGAPRLREEMLWSIFERVYTQPFTPLPCISYTLHDSLPSSPRASVDEGPDEPDNPSTGACKGYLWLPALNFLPNPSTRRWVVLVDWVLYVYSTTSEPKELLFIAPLNNVEPELFLPSGVSLNGTIKLALAKGIKEEAAAASTTQTSRRKKTHNWLSKMRLPLNSSKRNMQKDRERACQLDGPTLMSPSHAPFFKAHGPTTKSTSSGSPTTSSNRKAAAPVMMHELKLEAATPSDAQRWLDAFRGGLHSSTGAQSAEFAANMERYCQEDAAAAAGASKSTSPAKTKILHELEWAKRRGDLVQGKLWIKKPAFKNKEVAQGKELKALDELYTSRFTERYCSLLGNQFVVSHDATALDHHGVIDLSKLRMLVPTNNKWAKEKELFPFELVDSNLHVLCACAASSLKDYVLWFNAFTPLLPSKGRAKQNPQENDAAVGKEPRQSYQDNAVAVLLDETGNRNIITQDVDYLDQNSDQDEQDSVYSGLSSNNEEEEDNDQHGYQHDQAKDCVVPQDFLASDEPPAPARPSARAPSPRDPPMHSSYPREAQTSSHSRTSMSLRDGAAAYFHQEEEEMKEVDDLNSSKESQAPSRVAQMSTRSLQQTTYQSLYQEQPQQETQSSQCAADEVIGTNDSESVVSEVDSGSNGLASLPQTIDDITSAYANIIGKATALLNREIESSQDYTSASFTAPLPSLNPDLYPDDAFSEDTRTPDNRDAYFPSETPPFSEQASFDSLPKQEKKRRRENTPQAMLNGSSFASVASSATFASSKTAPSSLGTSQRTVYNVDEVPTSPTEYSYYLPRYGTPQTEDDSSSLQSSYLRYPDPSLQEYDSGYNSRPPMRATPPAPPYSYR